MAACGVEIACSPPTEPAIAPVTTSTAPAPPVAPAERIVSPREEVLAGIRVVSPTSRIATRHAVEVFARHKELLLSDVTGEAVTKDGKITGLRLFGIAPGTVAAAIGLENGDQVLAVNGKPLFDDQDWRLVFVRLGEALESNELELDVIRKGQPTKLQVHIDTTAP